MKKIRLGLIREGKLPPDHRVALTPKNCRDLLKKFPFLEIYIQPSKYRCCSANEYSNSGVHIREELNNCDILMGIKEVPITKLNSNKTYLFFSHTHKKQKHNRDLLKQLLVKKIEMIDYECMLDENGNKLVGFGRFAGIVGAHTTLWAWDKRNGKDQLKRALDCRGYGDLQGYYDDYKLGPVKIVVTGNGRSANGAAEILKIAGVKEVSHEDFLNKKFKKPVYTQLTTKDLYQHKDKKTYDQDEFYENPSDYESMFDPYVSKADIMIHAIYWDSRAPKLFTKERMKSDDFTIQLIGDIACDVNGAIPCTIKSTNSASPIYGYDPNKEILVEAFNESYVDVMAIDNLPNELPRDASNNFGQELVNSVFEELLNDKESDMILNSTIVKEGELTKNYTYLEDFINS
jgi:alanine dehydrogenase